MTGPNGYRYDECGLDNVILVGLSACTDDAGEAVLTIPNITGLHRTLTRMVAQKPTGLQPNELRFLRTELGLTQAELAAIVGKDGQTIGRWERGETAIEPSADTIVRVMALQHADDNEPMPAIEDLARRSTPSSGERPFMIDASDPTHYRELEAA